MIISITDIQSEQNDINVFIDGQNRNIDVEELDRLKNLFRKEGDICITFKNCNMSYIEVLQELIKQIRPASLVIAETQSREELEQLLYFNSKYHRMIISIDSEEKLEQLKETPNLIVPLCLIPLVNNRAEMKNIIINITDISKISPRDITKLEEMDKVRGVVFSFDNIKGFRCRNFMNFREFKFIRNRLIMFANICKNTGNDEISKFLLAYYLIGKNISYDFNEDGDASRSAMSHSLKGAILYGKAVCEGYSEALAQLLNILGIENKCVTGKSMSYQDGTRHVWNQIKINDIWYNCDITNDAVNIQQGRNLEYCLLSDEEFFLYSSISNNAERCTKSYMWQNINRPKVDIELD